MPVMTCKIHPEGRITISLANTLYCALCMEPVKDYEVFRTDTDRGL